MGSFQSGVTVFVKDLGPQASALLAEAAIEERTKVENEQAGRRGIKPWTSWAVDGVADAPFENVKPNGVIVEYWDYRSEIVYACFRELLARSPRGPEAGGHYRDNFVALLDGIGLPPLVTPTAAQLRGVTEIIITNTTPYARRLEVALTKSGRAFVQQVEPHIVQSAMMAVRQEFSVVATFEFNYVERGNAYIRRTNFKRGSGHKGGAGLAVTYPAIIIRLA